MLLLRGGLHRHHGTRRRTVHLAVAAPSLHLDRHRRGRYGKSRCSLLIKADAAVFLLAIGLRTKDHTYLSEVGLRL